MSETGSREALAVDREERPGATVEDLGRGRYGRAREFQPSMIGISFGRSSAPPKSTVTEPSSFGVAVMLLTL